MARVRWFGIALGIYQILSYNFVPDPSRGPRTLPSSVRPASFGILAGFLLVNLAVMYTTRRDLSAQTWRKVSAGVLLADCALLFGMVWIYSFERNSTTWVLLYILGLEGALRFQLAGAMAPVIAAFPLEIVRDIVREHQFGYAFDISSATYRVGIMAIVAAVAGIMARNLERERAKEHAHAEREMTARVESDAFHRVVLAGLEGEDLDDACDRVARAIASIFSYEVFTVLLAEGTSDGPMLRCAGAHGYPRSVIGEVLPFDRGICGLVATSGRAMIVADTAAEPSYVEWIEGIRSEMCLPIMNGGRLVGIVDVESTALDRFSQQDLDRLLRLAPQIGLVISNARLLSQERAAGQRLRELDQMKSDFVAITSHELRTPLTSIRGFVKTMRRDDTVATPEETAQYLAIIDRQSERLSRLVEDLLVVSRIEAGTVILERWPVGVPTMLEQVVEELGLAGQRIQIEVAPDLPRVLTDGERLAQVVRNLIENALKFSTDPMPVKVAARRDGMVLIVEVSDEGVGIAPEDVDRIFDRFFQVGGSMGRRAQGAGLGLYISRWIVEALGGRISVASTPGEGTTFTVSLPIDVVEEAVERTG